MATQASSNSNGSVATEAATSASVCSICSTNANYVEADPDAQKCILQWLSLLAQSDESNNASLNFADLVDGSVLLELVTRVDPDWSAGDCHGPLETALPRFACLEEYLDKAFRTPYGSVRVLDWDRIVAVESVDSVDDDASCRRRDWELLKACVLLLAAWLRQPRTLEVAAAAADALPDELQPRAPKPVATVEILDSSATTTDGRDPETAAYWLEVRLRTSELTRCRLEARVAELECQCARSADVADELRAALEDALTDAKRSRRRVAEANRAAEAAAAKLRHRGQTEAVESQARLAEAVEKADRLQADVDSLNAQLNEATQLLQLADQREKINNKQLTELQQELYLCRCGVRGPSCSDVGISANLNPVTIDRSVEACCIEPPKPVCLDKQINACILLPKPICVNKKVGVNITSPKPVCLDKELEVCFDPPKPICADKEVEACIDAPKPLCSDQEVDACIDSPKPVCIDKNVGESFELPKPICPVCVDKETETTSDFDINPVTVVSRAVEARLDSYSISTERLTSSSCTKVDSRVERDVEEVSNRTAEGVVRFSLDSPSQALLQVGKHVEARLDQTFDRYTAVTSYAPVDADDLDEDEDDELLSELNYHSRDNGLHAGCGISEDNDCSFRVGRAGRLSNATVNPKPAKAEATDEEELQLPLTTSSLLDALTLEKCRKELDLAKATNSALVARIDDLSSQLTRSRQQYQQLAAAANRRWSPVFPKQQQRPRSRHRSRNELDDSLTDERSIGGVPSLAEEEMAMWCAAERRQRLAKRRRASLHNLAAWLHPPSSPPPSASLMPPPPPPPPSQQTNFVPRQSSSTASDRVAS
uniref:Calponin-homology (CH) domain-containing protein n=2 Tax=Macrostomum lignano TaxID=282301 RepID=A0A1I8GVB4_9PLAT